MNRFVASLGTLLLAAVASPAAASTIAFQSSLAPPGSQRVLNADVRAEFHSGPGGVATLTLSYLSAIVDTKLNGNSKGFAAAAVLSGIRWQTQSGASVTALAAADDSYVRDKTGTLHPQVIATASDRWGFTSDHQSGFGASASAGALLRPRDMMSPSADG